MNSKVLGCLIAGTLSATLALASPVFARGGGGGGGHGGGGGMHGGGMRAGGMGGGIWWRLKLDSKSQNMGREMTRAPVLAAGGIVLRLEQTPLIAVVRLRKRNEWVLPKGKLDDGETPRDAALREVLEETGNDVSVHEFLGTLVYESGGRFKVVHYWRMQASGEQTYELMNDVKAVDWLPLEVAVERLSRAYERAFLANVGLLALQAAALAQVPRQPKARQPVAEKRRARRVVAPPPSLTPPSDLASPMIGPDQRPSVAREVVEATTSVAPTDSVTATALVEAEFAAPAAQPLARNDEAANAARGRRRNLVQKVRDWLRRAA